MSDTTCTEHTISIERLPRFYSALVQAFGESGRGGRELDELLSSAFQGRCPECGITMTAGELAQIVLGDEHTPLGQPKLDRLRYGYCARNQCKARSYLLQCQTTAGVDWPKTLARAEEILNQSAQTESASAASPRTGVKLLELWRRLPARQQRQLLVLAGLGLLLAGIHWYRSGAWIPGLTPKARVFIVESKPKPIESGGTKDSSAAPSRTNTPRTFNVR